MAQKTFGGKNVISKEYNSKRISKEIFSKERPIPIFSRFLCEYYVLEQHLSTLLNYEECV
jgi:hypothetical protein